MGDIPTRAQLESAMGWAKKFGHTETGWAAKILAAELHRIRQSAGLTAEQRVRLEHIRGSINSSRHAWSLRDYQDFYDRDITFLVPLIDSQAMALGELTSLLRGHCVVPIYDNPGGPPEICGYECLLCKTHDVQEAHTADCPLSQARGGG